LAASAAATSTAITIQPLAMQRRQLSFIVVSHKEISNDSAQVVQRRIASQTTFQTPQLNTTPAV
jgi:hypothetical protein